MSTGKHLRVSSAVCSLLTACVAGVAWLTLGAAGAVKAPATPPAVSIKQGSVLTLQQLSGLIEKQANTQIIVGEPYRERTLFISAGRFPVADLLAAVEAATGLVVRKIGGIDMLTAANARQMAQGRLPILPAPLLARLNKDLEPLGKNVNLENEGVPFPTSLFLRGKSVDYKSLSAAQQQYIMKLVVLHQWGLPDGWTAGDPRVPGVRGKLLARSSIRFGSSYLMGHKPAPGAGRAAPSERAWSWFLQVAYDYRQDMIDFPPSGTTLAPGEE